MGLAFQSPRVLILTPTPKAAGAQGLFTLSDDLARHGWPCELPSDAAEAKALLARFPVHALILDARSDPTAAARLLAEVNRGLEAPRRPVLGLGAARAAIDGVDLAVGDQLHPVQAALRLESLDRTAVAQEEYRLRCALFGDPPPPTLPPNLKREAAKPLEVLLIGEPAPKFLELQAGLARLEARVTGAFTAYTAFDYLHERAFDAVVLWSGSTQAESLSIAGGMRRNTRLFHIPTILALKPGVTLNLNEAFQRGLSDTLDVGEDPDLAALRIVCMAARYRRESLLARALDPARHSGRLDAATGLFTPDLFASHLAGLAAEAPRRNRPLSIAVLRISDRPGVMRARAEGWLDRAIPQMGSMVARLVRVEDTAARLANDVFALALPSANAAACAVAADRIAAVISCTAFEADAATAPFTVEFDRGVAELQPGESAASALERAARSAMFRRTG